MGTGRTGPARRRSALGALALLLVAACGRAAEDPARALAPGEWREFEGTWSAMGTRQTLHLGPAHRAAIVQLKGSVMLVGERHLGLGFQAEAIGFSDSATGLTGRCVWTDSHGEEVWSELQGQSVGSGNHVTGTFTGGTGRYDGVTGEYSFEWQYVVASEDGEISGRAIGLTGRARVGTLAAPAQANAPPEAPPAEPPSGEPKR